MSNLKMCAKCNVILDENNSAEYEPIIFVDKGYKLLLVKCFRCQSVNSHKLSSKMAVDTVINEGK